MIDPSDAPPPSMSHRPMSSVLARVEQQLRDLWAAPQPGQASTRVCTMNLVVVTSSKDVAAHYSPIIDDVTRAIPSRAIAVTMTPTANDASLDGEALAISSEDGLASSERVNLRATGSACARVGSAVEALVVPELPTTLVWLGRVHVDDPIFREIASDAQRVVLDTDYTSLASLLSLAKWARERQNKIAVADLAWTRVAVWQEMCARFFDDPAMRPLASHVESLRIVQMSEPNVRLGAEGSLMLGWFATRLGWQAERLGGALRFLRADKRPVSVELAAMPRAEGVAPLAIASVTLKMKHESIAATGTVTRDFGGDVADVLHYSLDVNLPSAGKQTVRLGANKSARVLERTLHRPAHDETLSEAVAFAERLDDDNVICA